MYRTARKLLVLTALMFSVLGSATAVAEPVNLTAEELRGELFVAGDLPRLSNGPNGMKELILEKVLQEVYVVAPDTDSSEATGAVQTLRSAFDAELAGEERLLTATPNAQILVLLGVLQEPYPGGVAGSALQRVVDRALRDSTDSGIAGDRFNLSADAVGTLLSTSFDPATVLTRSVALSRTNRAFGVARDGVFAAATGASIFDTTDDLIAKIPVLQSDAIRPVTDQIDAQDELHVDSELLRSTYTAAADTMNDRAIDSINYAARQDIDDAQRDSRANADAAAIRNQQSAGAFAARADRLARPVTATQKAVHVVKVAAQIGNAVGTYLQNSKVNTALKIANGGLGKAALSGNILLAATALLPLFVDSGPSADEMILMQLAAIQEAIADFRKQVELRFDELDVTLEALDGKLDQLATAVNDVGVNVKGVFNGIVDLQIGLDSLTGRLYDIADAQGQRDIFKEINFSLGYAARSGGTPLPNGDFLRADSNYFTFASVAATDAIAVPTGRSYAAGSLQRELTNFPLEKNFDYLRRLPAQVSPPIPVTLGDTASGPLANPKDWALAARTYSQLLLENPQQVTPEQRGRLKSIVDQGVRLQRFVKSISANDTSERSGSVLFNRLFDDYRLRLGSRQATGTLLGTMDAARTTAQNRQIGPRPSALPGAPEQPTSSASSIDPFGGGGQPLGVEDKPDFSTYDMPECEGHANPSGQDKKLRLPVPAQPQNLQWPTEAFLLRRLGLAALGTPCYSAFWDGGRFIFVGSGKFYRSGFLNLSIRFPLKGEAIRDAGATRFGQPTDTIELPYATYRFPEECQERCDSAESGGQQNPNHHLQITWNNTVGGYGPPGAGGGANDFIFAPKEPWANDAANRSIPNAYQVRDPDPFNITSPEIPVLRKATATGLRTLQQRVFREISDQLASGEVRNAAVRFDGAAKVLGSYAQAGFAPALLADDDLRGIFVGRNRLLDEDPVNGRLSQRFAQWANDPPATGGDQISGIATEAVADMTTAETQLARFIRPPAPARRAAGSSTPTRLALGSPLVDSTVSRLNLTGGLAANPLVPPATPPAGTPPADAPPAGVTPPAPPSGLPPVAGLPDTPGLTLTKAKLLKATIARGKPTKLSFVLSRAATVRVAVTKDCSKLKGTAKKRCKPGRPVVTTIKAKAGLTSVAFGGKLKRGAYRLRLTASDATGAKANPVTLGLRVR